MAEINIKEIQKILPHRYPFLLVDKIVELEEGKKAVGIKNVTVNEPFFVGHFPGNPVMPGVLIVEAMAQVGGVAVLSMEENRGKLALFAGIDKARFRKPVIPGEQLRMEVELLKVKGAVGRGKGTAYVNDEVVAEAELMYVLTDSDDSSIKE